MNPFSAILGLLAPFLFGGNGGSSSSGAGSLFSDPTIAPILKNAMFGADARSMPYIDPRTGQVVFEGGQSANGQPVTPSLVGLQLADTLRNDPLKAAITRLAGGLLPTSAGFNGGAFPTQPHFSSFSPTNPDNPPPGSTADGGGGTAGSSGTPGNSTGPGSSPRNRQLSLGPGGTPDFGQLLSQFRAMSAPALPPLAGPLAPPSLGM